jgi:hypothetical protein
VRARARPVPWLALRAPVEGRRSMSIANTETAA